MIIFIKKKLEIPLWLRRSINFVHCYGIAIAPVDGEINGNSFKIEIPYYRNDFTYKIQYLIIFELNFDDITYTKLHKLTLPVKK